MADEEEDWVKVLVPAGPPFEPATPESMWALLLPEPDHCEIRNTPWDAYGLNWGDVVRVDWPSADVLPEVVEVVRPSGHRTIRVIFNLDLLEPHDVQTILADLNGLDAFYEHESGRSYGIDVEPSADYDAVFAFLEEHHAGGRLIFEEAWKGPGEETQAAPDWL
jgi:uncharacterized protein DUF4265